MKNYKTILLSLIIFLSFFIRLYKSESVPFANDADELAYIYAGQALYDFGFPVSWSSFYYPDTFLGKYQPETSYLTGDNEIKVPLNRSWADHPPLIPIIFGGLSHLMGFKFLETPPSILYRLPVVLMSTFMLLIMFKIMRHFFDYKSSLLALIVAAFSPSLIIIHRMLVGDLFISFFLMLSIWLFLKKKPISWLIILAFLAVMSKVTGLLVVAVIATGFLLRKDYKNLLIYGFGSLAISLSGFLAYGYFIGLDSFIKAFLAQSYRLLGWSNPAFIFSSPGFQNFRFYDFSYFAILLSGLFGLFVVDPKLTSGKKLAWKFLQLAAIWSLFLIWATSAEQDLLGWYKLPLFSLLTILSAGFWSHVKAKAAIVIFAIMIINNLGLVRYPTHPLPETMFIRGLLLLTLVLIILTYVFLNRRKNLVSLAFYSTVAIYIFQGFYFNQKYFEAVCTDRICPVPTVTIKSLILGNR